MTDNDINAVEAALAVLNANGFDIASPRDGDLDDLEQERFNAVADACRAYLSAAQEGREAVVTGVKPMTVGRIISQIALWGDDEGLELSYGQGDDLARRILSAIAQPHPADERVVAAMREAARKIVPYLEWTISDESPGHHPTMPSAVGAFIAAFWGSREGYQRDRVQALSAAPTGEAA